MSACYILNRVPHKNLEKTPYDLWKGYPPNLSFFKVWGCLAKVRIPDFKRNNRTWNLKSFGLLKDNNIKQACSSDITKGIRLGLTTMKAYICVLERQRKQGTMFLKRPHLVIKQQMHNDMTYR